MTGVTPGTDTKARGRMRAHGSAFENICCGAILPARRRGLVLEVGIEPSGSPGLLLSRAYLVLTRGPSPAPRNSPEPPTGVPADFTCPCEKASVGTPTIARGQLCERGYRSGRPWGVSWQSKSSGEQDRGPGTSAGLDPSCHSEESARHGSPYCCRWCRPTDDPAEAKAFKGESVASIPPLGSLQERPGRLH